jgi:hypothetical protein
MLDWAPAKVALQRSPGRYSLRRYGALEAHSRTILRPPYMDFHFVVLGVNADDGDSCAVFVNYRE